MLCYFYQRCSDCSNLKVNIAKFILEPLHIILVKSEALLVCQYLKNKCSYNYRQGRLDISEKYQYLKNNAAKQSDAPRGNGYKRKAAHVQAKKEGMMAKKPCVSKGNGKVVDDEESEDEAIGESSKALHGSGNTRKRKAAPVKKIPTAAKRPCISKGKGKAVDDDDVDNDDDDNKDEEEEEDEDEEMGVERNNNKDEEDEN